MMSIKKQLLPQEDSHEFATHNEEVEEIWLISYADLMTLLVAFFALLLSFSKIDSAAFEKVKKETSESFGSKYEIPYENVVQSLKDKVTKLGLKEKVKIEQNDSGVTVTFLGSLFFKSGKTEITQEGLGILNQVVLVIQEQASDFDIHIEGHTDNRPISQGLIKSNWDLSSLRAGSVASEFERVGVDHKKIKILGLGDTQPIKPNQDSVGNPILENQAQNRRVVIQLIKKQ